MSETAHVYGAISAVMAHMAKDGISKDRKNQQQGYNFRGIDDIYNALGKVLAENKLVILPRVIDKEREERQTKTGGMLMYTVLTVEFDLVSAVDGSLHTVRMVGEAMDSADKSSNKAQSAALKYAALQVFMIPTESDNDADATTHEVAPQQGRKQPPPLTGPIKTRAELRNRCGEFVRELKACGDDDMLGAFLEENKPLIEQVKAEAEFFWLGDGADFLGLEKEIAAQAALVGADDSWRTSPLRAG